MQNHFPLLDRAARSPGSRSLRDQPCVAAPALAILATVLIGSTFAVGSMGGPYFSSGIAPSSEELGEQLSVQQVPPEFVGKGPKVVLPVACFLIAGILVLIAWSFFVNYPRPDPEAGSEVRLTDTPFARDNYPDKIGQITTVLYVDRWQVSVEIVEDWDLGFPEWEPVMKAEQVAEFFASDEGKQQRRCGYLFLVAALVALVPAIPAIVAAHELSASTYSIPLDLEITPIYSQCDCAVWFGHVAIPPMELSLLSVVVTFMGNFMFKLILVEGWTETSMNKMGDVLYRSLQIPSNVFTVPTIFAQLYQLWPILIDGYKLGGWSGYQLVMIRWIMSGSTTSMVVALYGAILADAMRKSLHELFAMQDGENADEGYMEFVQEGFAPWRPRAVRLAFGYLVFLVSLPGLLTNVVVTVVMYPWLALGVEVFFGLACYLYFPDVAFQALSYKENLVAGLSNRNPLKVFATIPVLAFIGFLYPVQFICEKIGLRRPDYTPLEPMRRTIFISLLVLLRVLSIQCYVLVSTGFYSKVSYLDAVPLSYMCRHWRCTACLLEAKVNAEWTTVLSIF